MKTPTEIMRTLMEAVQPPVTKLSTRGQLTKMLKSLDGFFHEGGGSSSATSYSRGPKNTYLGNVVEFLQQNEFRKDFDQRNEQSWTKVVGKPYGNSSQFRSHLTVSIAYEGQHVVNVQHSISMY